MPINTEDIPYIRNAVSRQIFRSCDYTLGGILLWKDLYRYEYVVFEDCLIVKGVTEMGKSDFSHPIGSRSDESTKKAIDKIKEYAAYTGVVPRFYFIPESALPLYGSSNITKLEGWSDYLYSANDLYNLEGKKYSKKRNHIRRFEKTYPNYTVETIKSENIEKAKKYLASHQERYTKENTFLIDTNAANKALEWFEILGFEGIILCDGERILGISVGEIVGDTLYVHLEKAEKSTDGIYEKLGNAFVKHIAEKYEQVRYVNREEDAGDEGLRKSKMSLHPIAMINKYEVITEI